MITKELINSEKWHSIAGVKDLDTTKFILSLYSLDDIDISEASVFLKNYINTKTPIEGLALEFISFNFQYFKQVNDTVTCDLDFDTVYYKILNHSVLGYYALLKEFMSPYTNDWELKQISTYSPLNNTCVEKDCWVSKKENISLEWATSASMLATIICNEFDQSVLSLRIRLYQKLNKKSLALFFDLKEIKTSFGHKDYSDLKRILL
jgi:hypothetical protein